MKLVFGLKHQGLTSVLGFSSLLESPKLFPAKTDLTLS